LSTDEVTELGPVLSRHDVDNGRRQVIAGWGLGLGLVGAVLSVIMVRYEESDAFRPGQGNIGGALIGFTLSALTIGAVYLGMALRRRGEYFEVRENGLVHAADRTVRCYPWDRIAYVRIWRVPAGDPIAHYFGNQYRGTIAFTDRRRRLRFNGLARRYEKLGAALMKNCAPAPRRRGRMLLMVLLVWLGLAAMTVGALIAVLS
jgi:hypothetical protein